MVHDEAYRKSSTLFAWCFELGCHLILSGSLSMLLVGFLIVETFVDRLNGFLDDIVQRVKVTITKNNRISDSNLKNYLTFTDDIEKIARFHSYIYGLADSLCELYGVPFLLFLLYFLIEMIVHLFFMYFVATHPRLMQTDTSNSNEDDDGPVLNLYVVWSVCSMFIDLCLLINCAHRIKEKNVQTRFTLWKFANERKGLEHFENMVSDFTLFCLLFYGLGS